MSIATSTNRKLMHDPKERKNAPRFPQSPFGDFPADYTSPKQKMKMLMGSSSSSSSGSAAASNSNSQGQQKHAFLKSHCGNGGKFASTMHAPEKAVPPPPRAGATRRRPAPTTEFRRFYERGDLPFAVDHKGRGRALIWKVDVEKLDYHHYLPIFFDGLREKVEPYAFIAHEGCLDLLAKGGAKILPTIPQLIIPIKIALNTRDPEVIVVVLKVLQKLVLSAELVGEALVPYYRQILPVLNLFQSRNKNLGDGIEYNQRTNTNLGDLIHQTLCLFEQHGGDDAFINIKYMVPTYESCVLN